MTSQERHEARYQRRKAKRQERKQARSDNLGPVNQVFSYRKMFFYGRNFDFYNGPVEDLRHIAGLIGA